MAENFEDYFSGKKLYGDDLSLSEIQTWYDDEKEGYANLGAGESEHYQYYYHNLNITHGYNYLPSGKHFTKVLGIGSAYGTEFEPIKNRISELYMLEPSDQLVTQEIFGIKPVYQKPTVEGKIEFEDNLFDLITCFGTLHHIPNVSFVMSEMSRILKPGGYLLIREPIISMGDWRKARTGLTRHERGIPINVFRKIIGNLKLNLIKETLCFTMMPFLVRKTEKLLKKPLYAYPAYLWFDRIFSRFTTSNLHYHAQKPLERIAPTNVFYVLQKTNH
jgi:SAM-dependent methyltransferase